MYVKCSLHVDPGHSVWSELRCCTIGQFRDWTHPLGGSTGGTAAIIHLAQTVSRKIKVWIWSTEIGVWSLMGAVPCFPLARQTMVQVLQVPSCTKCRSVPRGDAVFPLQKGLYWKRADKLLFCLGAFAGRPVFRFILHRGHVHVFIKVREDIAQTTEVSSQNLWADFTFIHFPKVALCIWEFWIYRHL